MKTIVVGGVAGGAGACARLRRNDENMEIIMLEKGEYISFANCGLPYYVGGVIRRKEKLQVQTVAGFSQRFNVDIRNFSEAIGLDTKLKRVLVKNVKTGEEYWESYDKIVLSPGAKPIRPNMPGIDLPHVFTLRNIPDTYAIKDYVDTHQVKNAVVVGGGYIGIEMAENLHHIGCNVHLIEAADQLVTTMDKEVVSHLHNYLRIKNVNLYLNSKLNGIAADSVSVESGLQIPADIVIMSIGVLPDTAFLKETGVQLTPRGEIVVDEYMKTNVEDVYAVGDAITHKTFGGEEFRNIALASPANRQARIVADNVCGYKATYSGSQGTAILKAFDLVLATTGANEKALIRAGVPYRKSYTYSGNHAGYYPGASTLLLKLLYTPEGILLGAQSVGGEGVDKRMDVLATALRNRITVNQLTELELAYAPPFNSAKDPVNMAGYVAENILNGRAKFFYVEDVEAINAEDIVLDVRTEEEFNDGHLPNAINIPLDELRERLHELDKNKKIYIYCAVGIRGYLAQRLFAHNGFKNTCNLSGGYDLYSVVKADEDAQKK